MSACAAALLVTLVVDLGVNRAVQEAEAHLRTVNRTYPAARVTFEVEGLVPPVSGYVAQLTDLDPERPPQAGDAALGEAAQRLAAVARMSPYMAFGYRPAEPTVLGALGHMFMHVDIFHLLGNMLFLWLAGGVLECFWRRWAYLLLFVGAGLGGLLAFHLSAPGSTIPLVGASGAVFGLLGAFVVGYPRTRIRIFYFLWAFRPFVGTWLAPALVVFPLWALVEVFYAMVGVSSGVAHWAHVGGFLVGVMAAVVARQLRLVAGDDGRIGPEASAASLAPSLPLPTLDPSVAPGVMPAHPSGAPARASGPPAAYPSVPTYSARPSASAPAYGIGPPPPSVPAYGVAPPHPTVPAYGAAPTQPTEPANGAAPTQPTVPANRPPPTTTPAKPQPAPSKAPAAPPQPPRA
ncbi:MAG: rhomboid family intramembrane serine protease, partial [Sandaracinaceae bacterium]